MKDAINSYFAVLLVTIAGAAATLLIVHVVFANSFEDAFSDSQANYTALQESILNQ